MKIFANKYKFNMLSLSDGKTVPGVVGLVGVAGLVDIGVPAVPDGVLTGLTGVPEVVEIGVPGVPDGVVIGLTGLTVEVVISPKSHMTLESGSTTVSKRA